MDTRIGPGIIHPIAYPIISFDNASDNSDDSANVSEIEDIENSNGITAESQKLVAPAGPEAPTDSHETVANAEALQVLRSQALCELNGMLSRLNTVFSTPTKSRTQDQNDRRDRIASLLIPVLKPEDTTCSICHDPYNNPDHQSHMLSCGHIFGKECIFLWLLEHTTCPLD
jgi:hypothetical protein